VSALIEHNFADMDIHYDPIKHRHIINEYATS